MINVVTLSNFFGVSIFISFFAFSPNLRLYFATMCPAFSQVEESGHAGPDAIISSGSPSMSDNTIENTCAGSHSFAKRPPFTSDKRFLIVLISTISAPQASSWFVIFCSSSSGIFGFSNKALPPPDKRNNTVSSLESPVTISIAACVALNEFSSGTG